MSLESFSYFKDKDIAQGGLGSSLVSIKVGIKDVWDNGFSAITDFMDAIDSGFSIDEAIARTRTLNICSKDIKKLACDRSITVLKASIWEVGCKNDPKFCCVDVKIDCDYVLSLDEKTIDDDLTLEDKRKLCVRGNCIPKKKCSSDVDCADKLFCPDAPGASSLVKCNIDSGDCYCGGTCPDGYCDLSESLDNSCPTDCGNLDSDSDSDSLSDLDEKLIYGTDPNFADSDADGLSDWEEIRRETDPMDPDTDKGGQCDGSNEIKGVCRSGPDFCPLDSNNECYLGVTYGASPYKTDTDSDGIVNAIDPCPVDPLNNCDHGNDPDIDLNGDGIVDTDNPVSPFNIDSDYSLDPDSDADGDLLTNFEEYNAGFDPLSIDSDGDGLPDWFELAYGLNGDGLTGPKFYLDPDEDSDGDGLTNFEEFILGTDPTLIDSDGDGVADGREYTVPDENTTIDITILDISPPDNDPSDNIYMFEYGQTIGDIGIIVEYSNGAEVISPYVFGELVVKGGKDVVPLQFNQNSKTLFLTSADYDLLQRNNETPFVELNIFAADPFGTTAEFSTRLFVVNEDETKFSAQVISPSGEYAYGQYAEFNVVTSGISNNVSVTVFSEGSGDTFTLEPRLGHYIGRYMITEQQRGQINFLVLATSGGKEVYTSVNRAEITVNPTLIVTYLPDESSSSKQFFKISYPNGIMLSESALFAEINSQETVLKLGDFGNYVLSMEPPQEGIRGTIVDSYGNVGRINIGSSTVVVDLGLGGIIESAIPFLLLIIVLSVVHFLFKKNISKKKKTKTKKQELENKKDTLKEKIKDTKLRFYKKKLSEEEASKRITDYEQELKQIEKELKEKPKK